MKINGLWIKHPRSKKPDAMLTLAVLGFLACIGKFLLNGVAVAQGDMSFSFGTVDASLIGALLIPTLGAYVGRKVTSSPDKKEK